MCFNRYCGSTDTTGSHSPQIKPIAVINQQVPNEHGLETGVDTTSPVKDKYAQASKWQYHHLCEG